MPQNNKFEPFPFVSGCHKQTILASFISFEEDLQALNELVPLKDGDKISLEITTPLQWKVTDLTVVMIHGLCGSHKSNYLLRMTKKLTQQQVRSIRVNLRGCGSGKGHAKHFYHSGCSDDILAVLQHIHKKTPLSPITLIGFSLGGNIALKLIGELGSKAKELVQHVIAVSPPADLKASVDLLGLNKNIFYQRYFIHLLRMDVHERQRQFNDMPKVYLPFNMSIYEFDEQYLAPHIGFKGALDYYQQCSSKDLVSSICIPCDILYSKDDPIIDCTSFDKYQLPSHIQVIKTDKGGHLGFLGSPLSSHGVRWMDGTLLSWIFEKNPKAA